MFSHLTAWAEDDPNTVKFRETFDNTKGSGGRDGAFNGNIGSSTLKYDNEGWTADKCGGASQCLKFGTGSASGTLTSPAISVGDAKYVLLTFSAAGWGDTSKNNLKVETSEGFTVESGDNNIAELENAVWNDYTVLIKVTDTSATLQLTFTGKRGFLDDIVVRILNKVPAPTLPDEFNFFPNTTEDPAVTHVTLTPVSYTTVYFTTDDSTPSKTNGTEALLPTSIPIHGSTTVKAIAYVGTMESEVVARHYEQGMTLDGIEALHDWGVDEEYRVYFADDKDHQVRVLYYDETRNQLFLRDNMSTLCIDFGTMATFNPIPQYNQHVAGWIVGKRVDDNGMLKLVATENTTTDFLAIADPVTEGVIGPHTVYAEDLGHNVANWVTIEEQRVGTDIGIVDRFGIGSYDGALIDVSGIVVPDGSTQKIAPITQADIPGVVYVVNESKDFTSPETDIDNAIVRLKRTLKADYWNTLTLPFSIEPTGWEIREYAASDGNTMHFTTATSIQAGIPYLVKTNENISDKMFYDVTLKAQEAQSVTYNGYSFVGTYSPHQLATDKTELFLTADGLGYPADASKATINGLRAYFKVPANANASLLVDGADSITGISTLNAERETLNGEIYNLNGQRVTQPRKGLYIVNGKKLIIQ